MSSSTNTAKSKKSTSNTQESSTQSKRSQKRSPLVLVNPLIISTDFDKQSVRISLSDTEVEVRKQNSAFYGINATGEVGEEGTPPSSSRFQVVQSDRAIALQKLILEDFDLKSQSTDQETDEDEMQEETEEETESREVEEEHQEVSDRTSVETQYSPQQEGSSGSRTTSSGKTYAQPLSAGRDDFQYLPEECLIFNFVETPDVDPYSSDVNTIPGITMRGDYYILVNLAQRSTATIEEIHSSSEKSSGSAKSDIFSPRQGGSAKQIISEIPPPRPYYPTGGRPRRMRTSNRIFPIQELTESSSNGSPQSELEKKTYEEIEKHIQNIHEIAAERNKSRPPSRRTAWDEEPPLEVQSMPELKSARVLNETFSPYAIEDPQHVEAKVSIRRIESRSLSSESKSPQSPLNIPEIEVIEPNSSESTSPCQHDKQFFNSHLQFPQNIDESETSSSCNCFAWLRAVFCVNKPPKRKRPIRVYKTYFCDICPECKCTTAYF